MKKIVSLVLATALVFTPVCTYAQEVTPITWGDETPETAPSAATPVESGQTQNESQPYLAMGQNLTAEQQATVLSLMGLAGTDISGYSVVTVTNAEEHQYLDSYISSSLIGTKSLSSVLVKPAEKGHGIQVTTANINYCTEGMYKNALATAGVTDADIIVAAPFPMSGTAALIGALKAYAKMTDTEVNETALDTSLNELVTTGELEQTIQGADKEDVEKLVAFIKAEIAASKLDTREDIEAAVKKGIEDYNAQNGTNISLTDDQLNRIVDVMVKINELGLDYNTLLDQAADLYESMGDNITADNLKDLIEENKTKIAGGIVKSFFAGVVKSIGDFFKGLFGN